MIVSDDINISLPWPPSANRYWRHDRGYTHVSNEAKSYKKIVHQLSFLSKVKTIDGKIRLDIVAYPPNNRKRDLDNVQKVLIDALQDARYFKDDCQIDILTIKRGHKKENGEVSVRIKCIDDDKATADSCVCICCWNGDKK